MIPTAPALMTQDQAAAYLAVAPRTLEHWRLKGGGPKFVRMSGRAIRYRKADIDAWIEGRCVASTSEKIAA